MRAGLRGPSRAGLPRHRHAAHGRHRGLPPDPRAGQRRGEGDDRDADRRRRAGERELGPARRAPTSSSPSRSARSTCCGWSTNWPERQRANSPRSCRSAGVAVRRCGRTTTTTPQEGSAMRFMMFIKMESGDENFQPTAADVAAMARYNEELTKAGALLALDGLQPPSKGARRDVRGRRQADGHRRPVRRGQGGRRRLLDHPDQVQGGGRRVGDARPGRAEGDDDRGAPGLRDVGLLPRGPGGRRRAVGAAAGADQRRTRRSWSRAADAAGDRRGLADRVAAADRRARADGARRRRWPRTWRRTRWSPRWSSGRGRASRTTRAPG